jgi:hypothetical protein
MFITRLSSSLLGYVPYPFTAATCGTEQLCSFLDSVLGGTIDPCRHNEIFAPCTLTTSLVDSDRGANIVSFDVLLVHQPTEAASCPKQPAASQEQAASDPSTASTASAHASKPKVPYVLLFTFSLACVQRNGTRLAV